MSKLKITIRGLRELWASIQKGSVTKSKHDCDSFVASKSLNPLSRQVRLVS